MAGFGSGFGGFGQGNSTQQSSSFGSFGSNATNSGFGSNSGTTTAFGTTPSGSGTGLFGSGTGAFGSSGFGSSNAANAFGSAPKSTGGAFGTNAPSSGGLFGAGSANTGSGSGFGTFGNNTSGNPSGFAVSGGMFSGTKPFGQNTVNTSTATSLFGGNGGGGFGATTNPGIGSGIGEAPGTGSTPFQAHQEKEPNTSTNQSNSFQNILFQEPYKKWSLEELKLADYKQGRRHGNASGTGAFGVSNFGTTTGGTFGNNQASGFGGTPSSGAGSSTMFGGSPAGASGFGGGASGGFGAVGTAGGLFNQQNKPSSSAGLFGGGNNTQSSQSNGLFGSSAGGGFGGSGSAAGGFANNSTNTPNTLGSGLFGSSNTQNKPAGFTFGGNGSAGNTGFLSGNTGSSFGAGANNGNQTGSNSVFSSNPPQNAGSGVFGNGQQSQQSAGAGFGTGAFSNPNQNTGTSLFGGPQQQKTSTGAFANNSSTSALGAFGSTGSSGPAFGSNSSATGLFGSQKPVTGGAGLFGAGHATQSSNTSAGGFAGPGINTQNPPSGQNSFQASGQGQVKPGLFGTSSSTDSIFGSHAAQPQNSLFGNQSVQQTPSGSLLGSAPGAHPGGTSSAAQGLTASISDLSAYGNASLFSSLASSDATNPGPLATPLSSKSKAKRSSILPMYKLNPASTTRFATPQKQGFGFSYSTYGTPASPSSPSSTPGSSGRNLWTSGMAKSLSKSVSSSNLRKSFSAEDSILTPGAFSASSGSRYYGNTGSVKRLVINKDMRSDLFATPTKEKSGTDPTNTARKLNKRVSFDTGNVEPAEIDVTISANSISGLEGSDFNGARPDKETNYASTPNDPTRGKELAIVHEEGAPETPKAPDPIDRVPGQYWMSPTREVILSMNRVQRQKVSNFTVGRDNVGYVSFTTPVDLGNMDLDDIPGGIVVLETRSATVYPNAAKKPPMGKGLNVPALISLEQSWPRGRDKKPTTDSRRLQKHIERLQRIGDTTFKEYNPDTGVWKFTVEHFTTYGLEYDEDDADAERVNDMQSRRNLSPDSQETSAYPAEDPDHHELSSQKQLGDLPGAFFNDDLTSDLQGVLAPPSSVNLSIPMLGSRCNALVLTTDEAPTTQEYGSGVGDRTTIMNPALSGGRCQTAPELPAIETPGGILRARMRALKGSLSPLQLQVADGDEWESMLAKSVGPQKRDRKVLKEEEDATLARGGRLGQSRSAHILSSDTNGFATSIDLMKSLFDKAHPMLNSQIPATSGGFVQWSNEYRKETCIDQSKPVKAPYPNCMRRGLSWGPNGTLVITTKTGYRFQTTPLGKGGVLSIQARVPQGNGNEVCMLKALNESSAKAIERQMDLTNIELVDGVPAAHLTAQSMTAVFHGHDTTNPGGMHEKIVWELASILFDRVHPHASRTESQLRAQNLSRFWANIVKSSTDRLVALAKTNEDKALASLAGHRVIDACKFLAEDGNFRLGVLVSLIGSSEDSKRDMRAQLAEWENRNVLSDFTDTIRSIYELLGGNVCACNGRDGVSVANRVQSFVISRRFGLDWKQAFGLRLWYACAPDEDISTAVTLFSQDIASGQEDAPQTWYVEQGMGSLWDDKNRSSRENLLWGLLCLYSDDEASLESILRPENCQLSPLDNRLAWQLGQALNAVAGVSFRCNGRQKADATTFAFAHQLASEGSWVEAVFVLLHLGNPATREKALQEYLLRYAWVIGREDDENFKILTQRLCIPPAWIWDARALYMRVKESDAIEETRCLIQASHFDVAHRTLLQKVAPAAIISGEFMGLSALIQQLEMRKTSVHGWSSGGDIYKAFLALQHSIQYAQPGLPHIFEKLLYGLAALREKSWHSNIAGTVAIRKMGNTIVQALLKAGEHNKEKYIPLFGFPLTQDACLRYSLQGSYRVYQAGFTLQV